MRVALVSPYSWTYPGGVTRHIEALAAELLRRRARSARAGAVRPRTSAGPRCCIAAPGRRRARVPDWLIPLGRTIGWASNGAVSNLAHTPVRRRHAAARAARGRLRRRAPARAGRAGGGLGRADLHRRAARRDVPLLLRERAAAPVAALLGARRKLNHLRCGSPSPRRPPGRGGASTAAATGSSPTASCCPPAACPRRACARPGSRCGSSFVGQAVERKGLPVLLRAFEALRRQVPAELTVVGVDRDELAPLLLDGDGVTRSAASTTTRSAPRCAPPTCCARRRWAASRSGWCSRRRSPPARRSSPPTSPATATSSRDGRDGLLVPRGDATRLAETLRDLALDPGRVATAGRRRRPQRRALRLAARGRRGRRRLRGRARRAGARGRVASARRCASARGPADAASRAPARRLPSLEPTPPVGAPPGAAARAPRRARRRGAGYGRRRLPRWRSTASGRSAIGRRAACASSPTWVLVGLGADVRLDAAARRLLARDPARPRCPRRCRAGRRDAGHDDRRADVRHAAGPARRALARADRRAAARAARASACRSCSGRSSPRRCSTCSRW